MLAALDAAEGPEGTWKVRMSFGGRAGRISILQLRMEGDHLTGSLLDYQGPRTAIQNTSYKDGMIYFEVASAWNRQQFTNRYTGTLTGDTMKGTAESQRRGRSMTVDWEATRTTSEEISRDIELPPVAADIGLNEENYVVWRDHILPDPTEMAWEQIPWLTTFKDGILAADTSAKPLLLWTMNGHPLGCT
jgi:hypothetical protein